MANSTVIIPLSGSVQGKGIKVVATATAGTAVHSTGTSATVVDRVYLYAYNEHTADVLLTLEIGGVTVPDNLIRKTIPLKSGKIMLLDGDPFLGSGSVALAIAAFAGTANVIILYGHVSRITP